MAHFPLDWVAHLPVDSVAAFLWTDWHTFPGIRSRLYGNLYGFKEAGSVLGKVRQISQESLHKEWPTTAREVEDVFFLIEDGIDPEVNSSTGKPLTLMGTAIYRIENEKIVEIWGDADFYQVIQQLEAVAACATAFRASQRERISAPYYETPSVDGIAD